MKKIKEFLIREIAGEIIMIPTGKTSQEFNGIITLSDTARFIWDHLEETDSLDEMITLLTDEYEISTQTATQDCIEFIQELLARQFVELTREDKTW